jgi:hypothetical protein
MAVEAPFEGAAGAAAEQAVHELEAAQPVVWHVAVNDPPYVPVEQA